LMGWNTASLDEVGSPRTADFCAVRFKLDD
jgi:hypothetical protein